jgi:DNA-binding MarR family transcriptional regulator
MRTHQAIVTVFARLVGMPASRLGLMRLIAASEGRLGTNELARRLGVNPAAVTRQLQELEADGLLRRTPDPKDGRRSSVALTPNGLTAFRTVHERGHAFERALETELSEKAVGTAVRVLDRLRRKVLAAAHVKEEEP